MFRLATVAPPQQKMISTIGPFYPGKTVESRRWLLELPVLRGTLARKAPAGKAAEAAAADSRTAQLVQEIRDID